MDIKKLHERLKDTELEPWSNLLDSQIAKGSQEQEQQNDLVVAKPTAAAAPVLVGIIDIVAERARLKSL